MVALTAAMVSCRAISSFAGKATRRNIETIEHRFDALPRSRHRSSVDCDHGRLQRIPLVREEGSAQGRLLPNGACCLEARSGQEVEIRHSKHEWRMSSTACHEYVISSLRPDVYSNGRIGPPRRRTGEPRRHGQIPLVGVRLKPRDAEKNRDSLYLPFLGLRSVIGDRRVQLRDCC
jgi:hypothetical protein